AAALLVRHRLAKRMLAATAALALVFTVLSTTLAAYRVQEVQSRSEAIIMAPNVEILGEPRKGSTRLFILHQGTKLSIIGEQGEWQEVRLASGSVGWLPKASIAVICPSLQGAARAIVGVAAHLPQGRRGCSRQAFRPHS